MLRGGMKVGGGIPNKSHVRDPSNLPVFLSPLMIAHSCVGIWTFHEEKVCC